MNRIISTLHRFEDRRILKVELFIDFKTNYDYADISFKCAEDKLEIISTSTGNINDEGNARITSNAAELYVDYCESSNKLECLVGYYTNNELINYEALTTEFDNTKQIAEMPLSVSSLGSVPGSHKVRFEDFFEALDRYQSPWSIKVTDPDDILLDPQTKGNRVTMMSFGENTKGLHASDYIFQFDPNVNQMKLPMELFSQAKGSMGVFELIKPDFLGVKNVYYKVLISNTLTIGTET